jgi:hypothetical protein
MPDRADRPPASGEPSTIERLADDVCYSRPKSDYARGFNDGIDALIARLAEEEDSDD